MRPVRLRLRLTRPAAIILIWMQAASLPSAGQRRQIGDAPRLEERQLLEAARREPHNLQVIGALGEFYFRNQEWKHSTQWLGKAYDLSGDDPKIGYDLAYALTQAGDLDHAESLLEGMAASNDAAKLHSLWAEVDDRKGDLAAAARELHRAAESEPSESNIFDLANYLLQHKKYVGALDDSIKFFRYGVAQFPRSARMMVGLGVALYAADNYDEAVRTLCAAVDLDPNDQRPVQFLGRASKVSPALASEVDRRLKGFADRYPESAVTNYFYALSLWERGGGEQGQGRQKIEQLLKKAMAISPEWYEPHYQLGVLYQAEDHIPLAIAEMNKAVHIDPGFFPAHYRLAVMYNRSGNKSAAEKEAAIVRELKAKDADTASAHDVTR